MLNNHNNQCCTFDSSNVPVILLSSTLCKGKTRQLELIEVTPFICIQIGRAHV